MSRSNRGLALHDVARLEDADVLRKLATGSHAGGIASGQADSGRSSSRGVRRGRVGCVDAVHPDQSVEPRTDVAH